MPAGLLGIAAGDGFRMCPGMCEMVFRMFTGMPPTTMPWGIGDAPRTAVTSIAGCPKCCWCECCGKFWC